MKTEKLLNDKTVLYNRIFYGLCLVCSAYFLLKGDIGSAASNLGLALIFDPFDQRMAWNARPRFQRIWLLVHVAVALALGASAFADSF